MINYNYSVDEICQKWLNNADLFVSFSEINGCLIFDFWVYGKIEDQHWKVSFTFSKWLHFSVNKDNLDDQQPYLILDCSISQKDKVDVLSKILTSMNINDNHPQCWEMKCNSSEIEIHVIADEFSYEINAISEKEYNSLSTQK